jgi:DNA-binding MarR family transcriptional regulator
MAATVAALADAGFVSRTPDPADGRRVLIGLTPAGADALAADRRRREDWLSDAIRRDLTVEERRTLVAATALLARIAASDGAGRR